MDAFVQAGTKRSLGHHWGTFQLTTEPHDLPSTDFARALTAKGTDASVARAVATVDVVEL